MKRKPVDMKALRGSIPAQQAEQQPAPQPTITLSVSHEFLGVLGIGLGANPSDEALAERAAALWGYLQGNLLAGISIVKALQMTPDELALAHWIAATGDHGIEMNAVPEVVARINANAKAGNPDFPDIECRDQAGAMIVNSGMPLWIAAMFLARVQYEAEQRRVAQAASPDNPIGMTLPTPPSVRGSEASA